MPDAVPVVPACPRCSSRVFKRDGRSSPGHHRLRCASCQRSFTARTSTPFAGYRWPREVIVMAVRWYGRFRLSSADVRDLLAERDMDVSARTVLAWVHTFGPLLAAEARRHARPVGRHWYVDETYVRVSGRWMYLYRAVDEHGRWSMSCCANSGTWQAPAPSSLRRLSGAGCGRCSWSPTSIPPTDAPSAAIRVRLGT